MLAYITQQFGSSEGSVLGHSNIEPTSCPSGTIIIKTHYASINPIDWKTRKGLGWGAAAIKDKLPWILGMDFSGEIDQVGENLTHLWSIGERVCGCQNMIEHGGTFAQSIYSNSSNICKIPHTVSLEQAAALPLAGLTAWQALLMMKIKDGEKVLICGGAGGVGHLAIQLAHLCGAQVSATCSNAKAPFIKQLGAHAIDYNDKQELTEYLQYFDVVIDTVGGEAGLSSLSLLKEQGRVVTLPTVTAEKIIAQAESNNQHAQGMVVSMDKIQLNGLLSSLASQEIKIEIEKTFSFEEIKDAFDYSESGRTTGKTIVKIT